MTDEHIEAGFGVFVSDTAKPFGAVRRVTLHHKRVMEVYVENFGDFIIPLAAVTAVHSQKVIVDAAKLDPALRNAIGHAHDAEDPRL